MNRTYIQNHIFRFTGSNVILGSEQNHIFRSSLIQISLDNRLGSEWIILYSNLLDNLGSLLDNLGSEQNHIFTILYTGSGHLGIT